jgi:hypothetical protein
MAQANFEPTFSCINTLTILKPSYYSSYLPAYEDGTECSETSAYKIQTPGNYPEENIQYHITSFKLRSVRKLLLRGACTFFTDTLMALSVCQLIHGGKRLKIVVTKSSYVVSQLHV